MEADKLAKLKFKAKCFKVRFLSFLFEKTA